MNIRFSAVVMATLILAYPISQLKAATVRVQAENDVKSDRCSFKAQSNYWECQVIYNDGESRTYYKKYSEKDQCNKVYYHPPYSDRVSGHCTGLKLPPISVI